MPDIGPLGPGNHGGPGQSQAVSLADEVVRLGSAAKGYSWGASGPDYYDCSGLVYRACVNLGIPVKGGRFSTFTIQNAGFQKVQGNSPMVGDIVVWPTSHMGVVTGPDEMYSAKSPSKGIGYDKISGDSAYFHGRSPVYYRTAGSGPSIGGVIGGVIDNSPLGGIKQGVDALVSLVTFFANPALWIRVAMFAWGIGLVIVGLVMARHGNNVTQAAASVVRTTRKVASHA